MNRPRLFLLILLILAPLILTAATPRDGDFAEREARQMKKGLWKDDFTEQNGLEMNLDSHLPWYPPHLQGAYCYKCPEALTQFAKRYGVENVVFVDDEKKCDRSVRKDNNIFINTRLTYWGTMILPPWLCQEPEEVILQRFLHEIGHVASNSPGDPGLASTPSGLQISKIDDPWQALSGSEGIAWKFVFHVREKEPSTYDDLTKEISQWYSHHIYKNKDWDDAREQQWLKKMGYPLPQNLWPLVPEWVKTEYEKITQ